MVNQCKEREITRDRYGRMVAEVYLKQSVNLQLVKEGAAVIYRQYFNGCATTTKQFEQAEAQAKKKKLGFWNQAKPVMPWDFRNGKRTPTKQGCIRRSMSMSLRYRPSRQTMWETISLQPC